MATCVLEICLYSEWTGKNHVLDRLLDKSQSEFYMNCEGHVGKNDDDDRPYVV